jgi:hypothetical protein
MYPNMHMRHFSRQLMLATFHAIVLCVAVGAQGQALTELRTFDDLITRKLVAAGFKRPIRFSFKVFEEDKTRTYVSDYQFPRKKPTQHFTCSISVAPAGTFLDPQEYERRRAEVKRDYSDRGEEYLLHQFPPIGKRAQQDFSTFGPGGGAFGLTFTTSDGKFDVRITISNVLPSEVETPDFDIIGTAKTISQLYDRKSG